MAHKYPPMPDQFERIEDRYGLFRYKDCEDNKQQENSPLCPGWEQCRIHRFEVDYLYTCRGPLLPYGWGEQIYPDLTVSKRRRKKICADCSHEYVNKSIVNDMAMNHRQIRMREKQERYHDHPVYECDDYIVIKGKLCG